ncbi:hypothetical protein KFL_000410260 [Klebsormidium nitens]|uniref:Methyltransferase FkbM domain-containing protein n=1 Tax=Klebsormidium nitens TaxID=105231 RepID=A0A1Y1HTR0_KLENI|nr:hypothetical protein KFL_000410260 [Klebsormidium nitens]|eukprot:GAQ79927.1 hypothetical protein KFL_000410260 [Klebsormidium nitens]
MKSGSWSSVISILLLIAGGAFLFYLGTVVGPAGKQRVIYVNEGSARSPLTRELVTVADVIQSGSKFHSESTQAGSESQLAAGISQSGPETSLASRTLVGSESSRSKLETTQVATVSGVRKHGDLCGLPDSQVEQLLSQPHGSKPWENRYSWDYKWWDIKSLRQHLYDVPAKDVECLLVSAAGVIPCLAEECLVTLYVRPHTSDIEVVLQLFDKLEYYYLADYTPQTILDAGGNVGFGALIFGTMFPDATIITIEPDTDNYRQLRRNTKHLANVIPLRAGLWWKVTALRIREKYKEGGHEWEYVVEEVTKADVAAKTAGSEPLDFFPAVTVDYLVQLFNLGSFDLAKIDIEGSEREVFTQDTFNRLSWLPKVKLLTVEQHENLKPGAEASVAKALTETFGGVFELVTMPEYQIWTNKQTIGQIANVNVGATAGNVQDAPVEKGPAKDPQLQGDPLEGLVSN